MKREIIFKAKDYNGNWQIGTYYYGVISFSGHYVNNKQIDEKTLCQFTGAEDKNGKRIFESDVDKSGLIVRWNQLHFCFGFFNENGAVKRELLCSPYRTQTKMYENWTDDSVEIIGNEHDVDEDGKPLNFKS